MKHSGHPPSDDEAGWRKPGSTSATLLEGVRAGDPVSANALASLYRPLVLKWCVRRVGNTHVAEDIVQEVFLVVVRRIGEFRPERPGSFRRWLSVILGHVILGVERMGRRQPGAVGGSEFQEALTHIPAEPDPADQEGDDRILCHRALELARVDFKPRTWQAAYAVIVDGQSPFEVADRLEMTQGAVRLAKFRVLSRVREILEEFDEFATVAPSRADPPEEPAA